VWRRQAEGYGSLGPGPGPSPFGSSLIRADGSVGRQKMIDRCKLKIKTKRK
jgi:hypothetical protein